VLARYAHDLQTCITHGLHVEHGDYACVVRDLQALQAATAKVMTELELLAGEK
jgi:hypothetical protein